MCIFCAADERTVFPFRSEWLPTYGGKRGGLGRNTDAVTVHFALGLTPQGMGPGECGMKTVNGSSPVWDASDELARVEQHLDRLIDGRARRVRPRRPARRFSMAKRRRAVRRR